MNLASCYQLSRCRTDDFSSFKFRRIGIRTGLHRVHDTDDEEEKEEQGLLHKNTTYINHKLIKQGIGILSNSKAK